MKDSTIIDKIYAGLLSSASNPDYGFEALQGRWGYKTSDGYNDKILAFTKNIRRLAKEAAILYNSGQYWLFDDKIYIAVREELIMSAYDLLLEHLRIVPMIGNRQFCKKYFIDTIRYYNPLNPRNDVIAFKNGVLDLRDLRLYDFSPKFHVTYYHPYEYNERAKCYKWNNFLHEVLPDKNSRLILQMFLGLGLIERGTVYNPCEGKDCAKVELCLILIGSGSNGKSVIFNTAMGIYGRDRISGIDYDELTSPGDEGMRARRLLRDALFNWSSDSDSRTFGRKRTGVFKRIVSGEPVTDRKIGEDVRENDHLPYLIFNLNELPYPDDQSLGFIRRLQFISFDVTIPKERQNKSLSQELIAEYPGIFNWVLRGARELRRRNFIFPSSEGNRRQMLLAQLRVNPVLAWINSYQMRWDMRARNEVGVMIPTDTLLESLEQFCADNEVEMVSKQKFGQTMARIGSGFFKKRGHKGCEYQIFGCTPERLKEHFVISKESMKIDYIEEKGTFITEDD